MVGWQFRLGVRASAPGPPNRPGLAYMERPTQHPEIIHCIGTHYGYFRFSGWIKNYLHPPSRGWNTVPALCASFPPDGAMGLILADVGTPLAVDGSVFCSFPMTLPPTAQWYCPTAAKTHRCQNLPPPRQCAWIRLSGKVSFWRVLNTDSMKTHNVQYEKQGEKFLVANVVQRAIWADKTSSLLETTCPNSKGWCES